MEYTDAERFYYTLNGYYPPETEERRKQERARLNRSGGGNVQRDRLMEAAPGCNPRIDHWNGIY